ncbi:25955_t:CDS:1 [Dentiscutata erythropus]|uniref:25955_t:CDS:1 n=1 Tax=Dentiscutata erythropus TaxID=1348616 RepID=A0A9N9FZ57_9GLOM|nr:25955_t:CDS:1 [Dentiscutata erythropus]
MNIKVTYNNITHKVRLSNETNWDSLKVQLCDLFNISDEFSIYLSYTDNDDTIITLSSDSELRQILSDQVSNMKFVLSTTQENLDSDWIEVDNDSRNNLVNENIGIIQVESKSEQDSTEQSAETSSNNSQIISRNHEVDGDEIIQEFFNVWSQSSYSYNTRLGLFKRHLYLIFGDCKTNAYIYIPPQYNQATVGAQYFDYIVGPRKYQAIDIFNQLKDVMKKLLENIKRMKGITRLIFLTFVFFAFIKLISITVHYAKIGLMWVGFFTVIKYIKNYLNGEESSKDALEFGKRHYGNMKNVIGELLE